MQQFIHLLKDKPATQTFLAHATHAYNKGLLSAVTYDQIITGLKLAHRPQGHQINSFEKEAIYSDEETLIYILLFLVLRQQELSGSSALKHSTLLKFFARWNNLLVIAHTLKQSVQEINTQNLGLLCHLPLTYPGDKFRERPATTADLLEQFKLYTIYQQQLFAHGYNFYSLELESLALYFLNQATSNQLEQLIPQVKKLQVRFINSEHVADTTEHTLLPHLLKRELQVPFAADVATCNTLLGQNFYSYVLARNQETLGNLIADASLLDLSNPHQAITQPEIQNLAQAVSSATTLYNPTTSNPLTIAYLLANNETQLQFFPQRFYLDAQQTQCLSQRAELQELSLNNTAFVQANATLKLGEPLAAQLHVGFSAWSKLDSTPVNKNAVAWDFNEHPLVNKFSHYLKSIRELSFAHKEIFTQLEQRKTLLAIPENLHTLSNVDQLTSDQLQNFTQLYQQDVNFAQACLATILRPTLRYSGDLLGDFNWDNEAAPARLQQLVKQLLNNTHLQSLTTHQRLNRKIITFIEKQPYQPHDFIDRFAADQFYYPRFMSFTLEELNEVFAQLARTLVPLDEFNFAPELVRFFQESFELFTSLTKPLSLESLHPEHQIVPHNSVNKGLLKSLEKLHNLRDWTRKEQKETALPQIYHLGLITLINNLTLDRKPATATKPFVVQRELLEDPHLENPQPEYLWSLSRSHRLETELYHNLKKRVYEPELSSEENEGNIPQYLLDEIKIKFFNFITTYRKILENLPNDQFFKADNIEVDTTKFGEQELAIASSLYKNFSCIIGGPGSGKTTTVFNILLIDVILHLACNPSSEPHIELIAPTGKAAEGLTKSIHEKALAFETFFICHLENLFEEDTQDTALQQWQNIRKLIPKLDQYTNKALSVILDSFGKTIHKSFGITPFSPLGKYNNEHRHDADIIIVDEVGMVSLELLHKLACYAKPHAKIIFLGDADQLPSIELGNTLANLSNQPRFISPQRQKMLQKCGFKLENFLAPQGATAHVKTPEKELIYCNPLLSSIVYKNSFHTLPTIADNIHTLVRIYRFRGNLLDYAYAINGRSEQTHAEVLRNITNNLATNFIAQQKTWTQEEVRAQFVAHYQATNPNVVDLAAQIFDAVYGLSYAASSSRKNMVHTHVLQFNPQFLSNNPADMNLQYYEPLYLGYLLMVQAILEQNPELLLSKQKQDKQRVFGEQILFDLVSCLAITSQQELQQVLTSNPSFLRNLTTQIQKRALVLAQQDLRYSVPQRDTFLQNLVLHQTHLRFMPLLDILRQIQQANSRNDNDFNNLIKEAFEQLRKVRFLSPVREGLLGVDTLNQLFIKRYNGNAAKVIMVTRNISEHQLVNGQLGILTTEYGTEVVYFHDNQSDQPRRILKSQIPEFEYAYYTTIHKSQGDEFTQTHVILPLELNANKVSRALYFTAVTRVKKYLFIYSPVALQNITEFTNEPRTTSLNFCWDYTRILDAGKQVSSPQELPTINNY